MVAVYQHSCAHRVSKRLRRRRQMAQAMAFDVWVQYTQHCHDLRVRMQQIMTQAAYAKLRGAFAGWRKWAAASAGNLWCPADANRKAQSQPYRLLLFVETPLSL